MKKISFFALALAAGLMMGCSDEVGNDVNPGGTGSATVGEGFMSVAINLPSTTGGSRASVDGFEDGLETEYAVKNGQLIIFGGNSEAEATWQATYDLDVTGFQTQAPNTDQITSTALIPVSTTDMTGPNFYAFVVLNPNNQDLGLTAGKKISDLEGKVLTVTSDQLKANGFMMTNSPLSTVAGGVIKPEGVSLLKYPVFDETKIKSNAQDALADPAATIYVERIHAKVTLDADATLDLPDDALVKMEVLGWALDNTNKTTYLMRNVKASDDWWAYKSTKTGTEYRFIEDEPVATGLYRTYWATDNNYGTAWSAANFNNITTVADNMSEEDNVPQYCLENTFDTDHQTEQNTTAVIVKARFNNGTDFYVANSDYTTLYEASDVQDMVKALCVNYIKENCADWYTGTIDGDDLAVTLSTAAGKVSATAIKFTAPADIDWAGGHNEEGMQTEINSQLEAFNGKLNVNFYDDGVAYYRLLIKHFGDTDTPWAEADKKENDSYPNGTGFTGESQWLGRYGMVRNNWYDLTVTGARELGSPTIPEATGNYDDDVNNLAVTINILSWAKRTQNVEL